jgi:uncharacterized protein with PQ loop repeat
MSLGEHHQIHEHYKDQAKHDFLHTKKYVRVLDRMVLFISILGPLFTIPQAWQIWATRDAQGLNLITWLAWFVFTIFWLTYGIAHKEKPLIVNNIIWIFIHLTVITGIILYG